MNRTLILIGTATVAIGVLWPWLKRLPLFRLPGDVTIDTPGFKLFFPITTMVLISLVVSALMWFFRR